MFQKKKDLLLGVDLFWDLLCTGQIRLGTKGTTENQIGLDRKGSNLGKTRNFEYLWQQHAGTHLQS